MGTYILYMFLYGQHRSKLDFLHWERVHLDFLMVYLSELRFYRILLRTERESLGLDEAQGGTVSA